MKGAGLDNQMLRVTTETMQHRKRVDQCWTFGENDGNQGCLLFSYTNHPMGSLVIKQIDCPKRKWLVLKGTEISLKTQGLLPFRS